MPIKPLVWTDTGFAHTPVGLFYRVQHVESTDSLEAYWLLERFSGSMTTKSAHADEACAKGWAFEKYAEEVMAVFEDAKPQEYPHKERWTMAERLRAQLNAYGESWERWAAFSPEPCGGSPMEAMDEDIGHHEANLLEAFQVLLDEARKVGADYVVEPEDKMHESHDIRSSDASSFDFICKQCGCTDEVTGGWGKLKYPCNNINWET